MILKQAVLLSLSSLFALVSFSQTIEADIIYNTNISNDDSRVINYNSKQKLAIADFKGAPDAGRDAVAITSSGFLFKAGFRSKGGKATLNIIVECSFDKKLSWMKEKGKNAYILGHEQHHFDISYIGAFLFTKKLKQTTFTADEYKEQLQTVYNNAINDMEALQNKYDAETGNGTTREKQMAWDKKIEVQLAALSDGQ